VDRDAEDRQRQEEVEARQQGPIHLQDVPPRRLSHSRPAKPPGSKQVKDAMGRRHLMHLFTDCIFICVNVYNFVRPEIREPRYKAVDVC